MFSENEAESRSVNELPEIIPNKQCSECNFEGKTGHGLKMHMKTDHELKCETCGFKTTTAALLKKCSEGNFEGKRSNVKPVASKL